MGNGQDNGSRCGYGMMGYGSADGRGRGYRGKRLCWKETDSARLRLLRIVQQLIVFHRQGG